MILYYCFLDENTPKWAQATIIAALAYFIFPADAIPDIIPVVGYTDDLSVLAAAIVTVAIHIKEEHIRQARETLRRWFW